MSHLDSCSSQVTQPQAFRDGHTNPWVGMSQGCVSLEVARPGSHGTGPELRVLPWEGITTQTIHPYSTGPPAHLSPSIAETLHQWLWG